jgi:hypothetical protein
MENLQAETIKNKLTLKKYKKLILRISINIRRSNMFFNITSSKGNTLQQFSCANFEIRHSKKRKLIIRFDIMQEFARELKKNGIMKVKLRFTNRIRGFKRAIKAFRREKVKVTKNVKITKYKPHNGCPVKHKKRLGRSRKKRIARLRNRFLKRKIAKKKKRSSIYFKKKIKLKTKRYGTKKFRISKKKNARKILFGPSATRLLMKFRTKAKHRVMKRIRKQQQNKKKIKIKLAVIAKNIKKSNILKNFYQITDENTIRKIEGQKPIIKRRWFKRRALDRIMPPFGQIAIQKKKLVIHKRILKKKKNLKKKSKTEKYKEKRTFLSLQPDIHKNSELITKIKNKLIKKIKTKRKKKFSKKKDLMIKPKKYTGRKIFFSGEKIITPRNHLLSRIFKKLKPKAKFFLKILKQFVLPRLAKYRKRKYYILLFKYRKAAAPTHILRKGIRHSIFSVNDKIRIDQKPSNISYADTQVQPIKEVKPELYARLKNLPRWLPIKQYIKARAIKRKIENAQFRKINDVIERAKFKKSKARFFRKKVSG